MSAAPSQRFLKAEHLRRPSDFKRVYDRRRSVSDEWLIVYACENALPQLVGQVARKLAGEAKPR